MKDKNNERETKTSAKSAAEAVQIAESVVTLTDRNKKLETKLSSLDKAYQKLQNDFDQLDKLYKNHKQKSAQQQQLNLSLQTDNAQKEKDISHLKQQLDDTMMSLDESEKELDIFRMEVDARKARIAELEAAIKCIKESRDEQMNKVTELQTTLAQRDSELEQLRDSTLQSEQLSESLSETENTAKKYKKRFHELLENYRNFQELQTEVHAEKDKAKSDLKEITDLNQKYADEIKALRSRLANLELTTTGLSSSVMSVKKRSEAAIERLFSDTAEQQVEFDVDNLTETFGHMGTKARTSTPRPRPRSPSLVPEVPRKKSRTPNRYKRTDSDSDSDDMSSVNRFLESEGEYYGERKRTKTPSEL